MKIPDIVTNIKISAGQNIFGPKKEEMSRISIDTVTLISHIVRYVSVRSRNSLSLTNPICPDDS